MEHTTRNLSACHGLNLPDNVRLRPMTEADLLPVAALEQRCQPHPWSLQHFRDELNNPVAAVDLLLVDEILAGYLCFWLLAGELEILNLAVAPEYRRCGIATFLLCHGFARGRQQGLRRALLEVRRGNTGAIALYRNFGFVPVGHRPRYYADGEDAVLMEWQGT